MPQVLFNSLLPAPSPTPPGVGKMWHPGFYVEPTSLGFAADTASRQLTYDYITAYPNRFRGGHLLIPWGTIETALNTYDYSIIDSDLAYVNALGGELIVEVWWQKYGGSVPDTRYFPQYIYDAGGVVLSGASDHVIDMNVVAWADRFIALSAALAARYDGIIEQFIITETATSYGSQYARIAEACATQWTRTPVILFMNFIDDPALAVSTMDRCAAARVGMGGPDIVSLTAFGYEDMGSRALRGGVYATGSPPGDFGLNDYRGVIPVSYAYQALSNKTVAQVMPYAISTLNCTHVSFACSEDAALPAGCRFSTGVLPYVNSVGGPSTPYTNCPSSFSSCVIT